MLVGVSIKPFKGWDRAAPVSVDDQVRMLTSVRAQIARFDLPWSDVESKAGEYDFSAYEPLVEALALAGIRSMIILGRGNPLYTGTWDAPPTTDVAVQAFGAYARAAALHFRSKAPIVEIYNEPNSQNTWPSGTAATQWVVLVEHVLRQIKTVSPTVDVPVISGGLAVFGPLAFARTLKSLPPQAWALLDGVGMHPYVDPARDGTPPEQARSIWLDPLKAVVGDKPIWNTEQGFALSFSGHDPAVQADYVARGMHTALANGMACYVHYDLVNDGRTGSDEDTFGLFDYDLNEKPAAAAFRAAATMLTK